MKPPTELSLQKDRAHKDCWGKHQDALLKIMKTQPKRIRNEIGYTVIILIGCMASALLTKIASLTHSADPDRGKEPLTARPQS